MINSILFIIFLSIYLFYPCFGIVNQTKLIRLPKTEMNINSSYLTPENYGKTWMLLPDENNMPKVVYLSEVPSRKFLFSRSTGSTISFYLYTRNKQIPINIRKRYNLLSNDKLIKIIVHGWFGSYTSEIAKEITDAYLTARDYYVIALDWSELSQNPYYFDAAINTRTVAKKLAEFIDVLVKKRNINIRNIHLIGYSLGAHVCGFAAKNVKSGKIYRITGLDPAMPGFEYANSRDERLDANDAVYIDVYHTSSGSLGMTKPIGTVDIYINGGKAPQPGCSGLVELLSICSHARSYKFFAESITSNIGFYAYKCDSYYSYTINKCDAEKVIVGDPIRQHIKGTYYVSTNTIQPLALGRI